MTNLQAFADYIDEGKVDECWPWIGPKTKGGYGVFRADGIKRTAHSIAYIFFVAEVPDGAEVHHKCKNRACCNPVHLQSMSITEHREKHLDALLEMTREREENRTHCKRGHPLSVDNLYASKPGIRRCAACNRDRAREAARQPREVARRKIYMAEYYKTHKLN